MKSRFLLLCALIGLVVAFRIPSRTSAAIKLRTNPIRAPSLVLGEKEEGSGDEEKIENALWMPEAVSSVLKSFNLPNILLGTFLGAVIVIIGLFGPIFLNDTTYLPDGNVVIMDDEKDSDSRGEKNSKNTKEAITKSVTLFSDILSQLRNGYVDELDSNQLFETAIGAMLKSLDPYTEFENVKQSKAIQESVQGKYGGVGLVIANQQTEKDGGGSGGTDKGKESKDTSKSIAVVDAFEGYSYENGLRVGDRLVQVSGVDVSDMRIDDVRDLLRGEPDTEVKVVYERDGVGGSPETRDTTLKRQTIRLSDVRLASFLGNPEDRIGYISLSGFNAGAARDFRTAYLMLKYSAMMQAQGLITPEGKITEKAIEQARAVTDTVESGSPASVEGSTLGEREAVMKKLEADGPGLNGLVLDLRGNPGGLLDAAVEIASYLVPPNSDIVSAKSRSGPSIIYRSSVEPIRDPRTKLVVLVNRGSASASEIVSGAIQDLDAGVIMGESRTYGKGLVQKIVPLPYDSALKYTIAKYYTPSGRCIQAVNYAGGRGDELALEEAAEERRDAGQEEDDFASSDRDEDDNAGGSFILRSPGAQQDKADGASYVRDKDRKTFYTANGRSVLDAGGIEPDIKVTENVLTPTEKIFVSKDVYNRFVKDYLKKHAVMNDLREIVAEERANRDADPRYVGGNFPNGKVVSRYLVLQTSSGGPVRSYLGSKGVAFGKVTHDALYRDFKSYVQEQVKEGKLELDGLELERSIKQVEKSLKSNGLDSDAKQVATNLRERVSKGILKNMDKVKDNIADGLEVAFMSRELPDRLLLWRAVTDDMQVKDAVDVLTDKSRVPPKGDGGNGESIGNKQTLVSAGKSPPAEEYTKSYSTALAPPDKESTGVTQVGLKR